MAVNFKMESGVQLLARLTKKPVLQNFYPHLFQSGPRSGDLIEIYSDTYTSHLLIDIISEILIETKLNGSTAGVLIFETDGNLDYDALVNVIRKKVLSNTNIVIKEDLHEIMSNLHVFNIYDATQLYTTILKLDNLLLEYPNISLLIFNTLTAFYWSEQGYKITRMDLYTKNLINTIQKVTKEYKTICMYTRPEYFFTNKDSENNSTEVNYQIQLLENGMGNYQVNIKTLDIQTTKFFRIVDGDLKWST